MIYFSTKSVPTSTFTSSVSATLNVALMQKSSILMRRLICPKQMIGSTVAERKFGLYLFRTSCTHETVTRLFANAFDCSSVSKRQSVNYRSFVPTPVDCIRNMQIFQSLELPFGVFLIKFVSI